MKGRRPLLALILLAASLSAPLSWAQPRPAGAEAGNASPGPGESTALTGSTDPGEFFVNAGTAYEAGDHERAITLYSSLLDLGWKNGTVYYNLGNAYLRNGELGRAIAAYRHSESFQPRDEDLQANLAFARNTAKDAIQPPRPSAVLATLFFWHYQLSRSELIWTVIVVNLLLWSILLLRLYRRASEALRWIFFGLLLVLLATGASLAVHTLFPQRIAVVVPQEVEALTGPGEDAVVRFKLHAGTEVRVRDQRDGWVRIALPDGQQGWVASEYVEVVEL
jgi:tetratricopeptide (TPR) repeat protein